MFITVIGGASSGKSEIAERVALKIGNKKAYIATMQNCGDEASIKIVRHRAMRKGKGFDTIECSKDIHQLNLSAYDTILLECMSNWAANDDVENIYKAIVSLKDNGYNIIIVTCDIFADTLDYNEDMLSYIHKLADINIFIARLSDTVIEVCAGIPYYIKGCELL